MLQKLANHNDDLQRLLDKGYAVAIDSNYLVIRDIPYLDENLELKFGAVVSKLKFTTNEKFEQVNHQIFFSGTTPHGLNGKPVPNLGERAKSLALSSACSDFTICSTFSNKPIPSNKYDDHFHKIETYVGFISGPAMERYNVTPYTFGSIEGISDDSVFKFRDTLSSKAEINDISNKLSKEIVAVIGLGGTGAYLLDFLTKCSVSEIRGFDHDLYHVHNAFRSPGRLKPEELNRAKTEVYKDRYDNFRKNLHLEKTYIDTENYEMLNGVTFAFVSVDSGTARAEIIDVLTEQGIPFIDVGMGLTRKENKLGGMVRTTYFPTDTADRVRKKKWVPEAEDPENEYKVNIQSSELNALNASIAIIRFKQVVGFYEESQDNLNMLFSTASLSIMRSDIED